MSDANQTASYYALESSWGETPDGSATLIEVPTTGDTLNRQKITADRATIKSNRMGARAREVGISVEGDTNHELSAKDFEDIIGKGGLSDAAAEAIDINAETCTTSAAGNTITAAAGTPFAALATLNPKFIRVAGGAESGTNGVKKVVSITSTVITLDDGSLTDDETSVALDIDANVYSNGTDDVSFLWERQYADLGLKHWFNGLIPHTIVLTVQRRELVTMVVSWMGKTGQFGINSAATGYLVDDLGATLSVGATSIPVDGGTRALPKNTKLTFAGDGTVYKLAADYVGGAGSLTITPGLIEAPADNAVITLAPDPQATAGDGSPTADAGTDAINASSDVLGVWIDDSPVTECVDALTLTIENAQRERPCIGKAETAEPGKNRFRVSGSLTMHFEDYTEYQDFLDHETKSFAIAFLDPDDNLIGFSIPALTYNSTPGPVPTAEDTDIMIEFEFSAHEPASAPLRLIAAEFLDA